MKRNHNASIPTTWPAAWITAVAVAVATGGCSNLPTLERGRELGHRRNGVPDTVVPGTKVARSAPAARPPAPAVARGNGLGKATPTADPGPALAPAPGTPPVPPASPVDPFAEVSPTAPAGRSGRAAGAGTINVFGEMDGAARPPAGDGQDGRFQRHTFADDGVDSDVNADPTGKWLVFASTRHSDRPDLYVQRADGSAVTQLTTDPADDACPCFSPDGKQIAFASTRGGGAAGGGTWQIYTMDVDGRNVTQITRGPMQCVHPTYSPDGTRLAYSALNGKSGQWEIWLADLRTGERRAVAPGLFPAWSPDRAADRIAFQRPRQRGGHWFSLWTLDLIDGEPRRLTEVAASPTAAVVSPAWSPDGRRLVFVTVATAAAQAKPAAGGKGTAGGGRMQQDVWTIDADGTNRQRLTDGTGTNLSPCWAADGRVYFVSDRGGNESVWSVRAPAAAPAAPPAVAGPVAVPEQPAGNGGAAAAVDTGEAER